MLSVGTDVQSGWRAWGKGPFTRTSGPVGQIPPPLIPFICICHLCTPQEYWSRWSEEEWNAWNQMPRDVRGRMNDEIYSVWMKKDWAERRARMTPWPMEWPMPKSRPGRPVTLTPGAKPAPPAPPTMAPPQRPPPGLAINDEITFLMQASAKLMERRAASRAKFGNMGGNGDAHANDVEEVVCVEASGSGSGGTGGSGGGNVMYDDDQDDSWGNWKRDGPWRGGSGQGDAEVAEKR